MPVSMKSDAEDTGIRTVVETQLAIYSSLSASHQLLEQRSFLPVNHAVKEALSGQDVFPQCSNYYVMAREATLLLLSLVLTMQ